MDTADVQVPRIAGPENVDDQSLPMMFKDVVSTSRSCPKICDMLIYDCLKSF